MKSGIYPGLSADAYHSDPALSRSRLKSLLTGPPLEFHAAEPVEETEAMRLGTALHLAILEPDRFAELVRPMPKYDGRTNAGKAAKADWLVANPGKIAVPEDDYAQACAAAKLVRSKKGPATALREGKAEVSLFWPSGDVVLKSRPDFLDVDRGIAVDVKSTSRDLSDRQVTSILEDQFGALQAAMVTAGVHALTGKSVATYLLVVKLTPPLDMRLVLVGDLNGEAADLDWLERGDAQLAEALRLYRDCTASGLWPGWCDVGVTRVPAPAWIKSRTEQLTKAAQDGHAA